MAMAAERYDTIIVGAGIVGSALAVFLSQVDDNKTILVVDRSLDILLGSTGQNPGFVGQLNTSSILTKLAQASVKEYQTIPKAFQPVGGLELASSDAAMAKLHERCELATGRGLRAEILSHDDTLPLLQPFVRRESFKEALHFPDDGVLDAKAITEAYRNIAQARGVELKEGDVTQLEHSGGKVTGVSIAQGGSCQARNVVLATGIWMANLLLRGLGIALPIVPVAHRYVYSKQRPASALDLPFVRWPEHTVYARSHGDRDGCGSYDHAPLPVDEPGESSMWGQPIPQANAAISKALSTCITTDFVPDDQANGNESNAVFSVTPDDHPFVGSFAYDGLWVAAAVWVTHASGCAKWLVGKMEGEDAEVDIGRALDPARFRGEEDTESLKQRALRTYNDIYVAKSAHL